MKNSALLAASLFALGSIASVAQSAVPAPSAKSTSPAVAASYGKLPLSFEANRGQTDPQVKFLSRGAGYSLFLTDKSAVLALTKGESAAQRDPLAPRPKSGLHGGPGSAKTDVVRMELVGSAAGIRVEGGGELPGKVNYLVGNDPAKWQANLPTYARVKYSAVYPGVDLVYYGNQSQLEYDFLVAPNADPKVVRLHFAGAEKLRLNANGDLTVAAKNGEIAFQKPVLYQVKDGRRQPVTGAFALLANNDVGFQVGNYDRTRELVIDPTLAYSTYLAGNASYTNLVPFSPASAMAIDTFGNAYIAGETSSETFPLSANAFQTVNKNPNFPVIFVARLNAGGSALDYCTYLGGTLTDEADTVSAIAVDGSGHAYITGNTDAPDFPTTAGAFQTNYDTNYGQAFVTKLNATGSGLVYSGLLGGPAHDSERTIGFAIAVDGNQNVYVTGNTGAADFPVTAGAYQTASSNGVFVTKINPAGTALVYSTYITLTTAGSTGTSIAIDPSGAAYVAGKVAQPTKFPVSSNAFQKTAKNTTFPPFVFKLNPSGSTLVYSTFLTGSAADEILGLAVDGSGYAYVTGGTGSRDFPTTSGAFQTVNQSPASYVHNAFVTKLNLDGSGLVYSTYLGGTDNPSASIDYGDIANTISVDGAGDAYVAGLTFSKDFPVTADAFQAVNKAYTNQTNNAFLTELNPTGSALIYSTYLGGSDFFNSPYDPYSGEPPTPDGDAASAIAIDGLGNVYLAGSSWSTDFPVTAGAFQSQPPLPSPSVLTAFVTKFAFNGGTKTTIASNVNPQQVGSDVTFTASVAPLSGTAIPKGSVSFIIDGAVAATVALNSLGEAAYTTGSLFVGTHTVVASYLGDPAAYSGSNAGLTETITGPRPAPPVFSPAGGVYPTLPVVTLTSAVTGASIYYTLDGSQPTPSSTLYTGPIAAYGSPTIQAIAVVAGESPSAIAQASYATQTLERFDDINYSQGFATASRDITLNGSAQFDDKGLILTSGGANQAGSAYYAAKIGIVNFTTDFTFLLTNPVADGFTFTIQNSALTALGGSAAGLGYVTIPKSVAIKFDLYNNAGEGPDSTGVYSGGKVPTVPAIDLAPAGIDLHSGDAMGVHMTYDGTVLNVTITDQRTGASSSQAYTINIPDKVGGTSAYVGFTGGTGSGTASQEILSWSYAPDRPTYPSIYEPGLFLNGSATNPQTLHLTNGGHNEAGSAFYRNAQNIQSFTNDFTFQLSNPVADGFTFTIQGTGPNALGGSGSGLGYTGIHKSVAIKFDLYNNAGEGPDSTGIYSGGNTPTIPAIDLTGTGINLHDGAVHSVDMNYNGTVLTVSIDGVTHSYNIDIPAAVGGTTAYVGFTGGTGAGTSTERIRTWSFN